MEQLTPGQVSVVSVNLDLITDPERIASVAVPGARMMAIGNPADNMRWPCYKAQQWGSGASGNHNAKWRRLLKKRRSGIDGKLGR